MKITYWIKVAHNMAYHCLRVAPPLISPEIATDHQLHMPKVSSAPTAANVGPKAILPGPGHPGSGACAIM